MLSYCVSCCPFVTQFVSSIWKRPRPYLRARHRTRAHGIPSECFRDMRSVHASIRPWHPHRGGWWGSSRTSTLEGRLISLQRRTFACSPPDRTLTRLSICLVVRPHLRGRNAPHTGCSPETPSRSPRYRLWKYPDSFPARNSRSPDNLPALRCRRGDRSDRGCSSAELSYRFRLHR